MQSLLGIDIGLKTGLALYNEQGSLLWYRSHNFGTRQRLKSRVYTLLYEIQNLSTIVLEGGGSLASIWEKEALKQGIFFWKISAEKWRKKLLLPREQRTGYLAKQAAFNLAREVIVHSDIKRPTSLRYDTAEAILIGLWGIIEAGWFKCLPDNLPYIRYELLKEKSGQDLD